MNFSNSPYITNSYMRNKAVKYALDYALKPNTKYKYMKSMGDDGGDCSNFVSQCLAAGGAPMAYGPQRPWWYNKRNSSDTSKHTWSQSWSVAHSLYWCLKVRGNINIPGVKAIEVPSLDMLELGDLIQYEDSSGIIYHSAIITAFTTEKGVRIPQISQHSVDAANTTYIKPKAKKMHFMKIIIS